MWLGPVRLILGFVDYAVVKRFGLVGIVCVSGVP